MLKRTVMALLPLVAAAGCKDFPGPQELATTPPPAFDVLKKDIDAGTCEYNDNQYSLGGPSGKAEMPKPVGGCNAYYPRYLLNADIHGACSSMFDLDDAGKVINLETQCHAGVPRRELPEGWAKLAEAAFTYSVEKQLMSWTYPAKGAERQGQRRHTVYVCTLYGTDSPFSAGETLPFQRSPPAPPLPPDLIEMIEKIKARA